MSNRILLLIFSLFFLSFTCFSQEKCGSYKGYLADDIKKYPEFYKNLEQLDAELEKAKNLLDKLKTKFNFSQTINFKNRRILRNIFKTIFKR